MSSKWETVDPEDVKAGAVTTSKWEVEEKDSLVQARKALMGSVASKWDEKEEDIDGEPLDRDSDSGDIPDLDTRVTEERRALLRDVEVKVMQYQDELENGRKGIKSGWTISEQVEHYRKKMLRKATEKLSEKESPRRSERGRSPGEVASDSPERRLDKSARKKKRRRTRSSSVSKSKSRERNRSRDRRERGRRRKSSSSSPERGSKRSRGDRDRSKSRTPKRSKRSRSRSPRKHKKKRH